MSGNTIGRSFCVTTFGESHGPAIGAIVDGCPPGPRALGGGHPGRPRAAAHRHVAVHEPAPGTGPGEDPLGRVRGPDDGHGDRPHRRQRGCPRPRLREDQGPLPSRPRRLRVSAEIRHPRLSRRRARLGAHHGRDRRGRRDRAQVAARAARPHRCRIPFADRAAPPRLRGCRRPRVRTRSSVPTRTSFPCSSHTSRNCAAMAIRSGRA